MCWITYNKPIKKIAKEDIQVFKLVRDDLKSLYYNFQYEVGKTYTSEIYGYNDIEESYVIENAIHSYSTECMVERDIYSFDVYDLLGVRTEIRAYVENLTTLLCVIPKGSTYYINERGEYVSDTIRIEENVPTPMYFTRKKYSDYIEDLKD